MTDLALPPAAAAAAVAAAAAPPPAPPDPQAALRARASFQTGCDGWKGGGGHSFESVALKGPKVVTPVMERVAGTMVMVPRKKLA